MKYRKLRIAWSVGWGILCLLLIVLWVRSYWLEESLVSPSTDAGLIIFTSSQGSISVALADLENPEWTKFSDPIDALTEPAIRQWNWILEKGMFLVLVPHWFPTTLLAFFAALPWISVRFTLRTLMIAATLLAVGLGVAVLMLRGN